MPETPAFEKMAHAIAMSVPAVQGATFILHREHIAEQLRLIWNARGAADIVKLEAMFDEWAQPSMKTLDHAVRSLDR